MRSNAHEKRENVVQRQNERLLAQICDNNIVRRNGNSRSGTGDQEFEYRS